MLWNVEIGKCDVSMIPGWNPFPFDPGEVGAPTCSPSDHIIQVAARTSQLLGWNLLHLLCVSIWGVVVKVRCYVYFSATSGCSLRIHSLYAGSRGLRCYVNPSY